MPVFGDATDIKFNGISATKAYFNGSVVWSPPTPGGFVNPTLTLGGRGPLAPRTSMTATPTPAFTAPARTPGPTPSRAPATADGPAPPAPLTSTIAPPIPASMGRLVRTRALTATSAPVLQGVCLRVCVRACLSVCV